MEKEGDKKVKNKKGTGKVRIVFSTMILFVLLLAEIYMMIHPTDYFEGLVTVSVLLLAVLYILVVSVIQVNFEREEQQYEVFDDIFKSEKASYLLMRKNFEEITARLEKIEDNMRTPTEDIIDAQKAIAKVSISRNKENTDALMNANDKLFDRILGLEEQLGANNDKLLEQQRLIIEQANKEIMVKQQEAVSRLREAELSIKNEILQSFHKVSSIQPQVVMATPQYAQMQPQEMVSPAPQAVQMPVMEESQPADIHIDSFEEENILSEESLTPEEETFGGIEEGLESLLEQEDAGIEEVSVLEDTADVFDEELLVEEPAAPELELTQLEPAAEFAPTEAEPLPVPIVEEKPPMPELDNPNKMMTPDEIAALLANIGGDDIAEPEPEPIVEEKPPMPELDNPNKMMTPDEIAALLANIGGDDAAEPEPAAPEPEPEPEPAPAAPLPGMSDPNKIMTPDEIAALLASMQ